jgi:hypothetical protein
MLKRLQNAVVIALFACVVLLAIASRASSQQPQGPQPHTNERTERPGENENRANTNSDITSGSYLQKYSTYCATEPEKKDDKWRHEFWCEFKITDAVIAAFTVVLAIVTAGLIIVGICQTRQVAKTIALSREEFISTHRPRLKIREIDWDNSLGTPPIKISYAVVNVGETPAHIFERRNRIYFSQTDEPLHGRVGWTTDQMFHEENTIPGGKRGYFQYETTGKIHDEWPSRVINGKLGLKVVGEIGYRDNNGVERWVGFLRSYDWKFRRFRIVDDPDYEYAD